MELKVGQRVLYEGEETFVKEVLFDGLVLLDNSDQPVLIYDLTRLPPII